MTPSEVPFHSLMSGEPEQLPVGTPLSSRSGRRSPLTDLGGPPLPGDQITTFLDWYPEHDYDYYRRCVSDPKTRPKIGTGWVI